MASITCTKCGAVHKTKAPVAPGKKMKCPRCDKAFVVEDDDDEEGEDDQARKKKVAAKEGDSSMMLVIGGVAVLLLCLVFAGGGGAAGWYLFIRDPGKTDQLAKKQGGKDEGKAGLTAEAFTKEFVEDEKKAQDKYKDKTIEVTGKVIGFGKAKGPTVVTLSGAKRNPNDTNGVRIQCELRDDEENKVRLGVGKNLKFTGKFKSFFGDVTLSDCSIAER